MRQDKTRAIKTANQTRLSGEQAELNNSAEHRIKATS